MEELVRTREKNKERKKIKEMEESRRRWNVKGVEESRRYTRVEEKIRKKQKRKNYILLCRYIILMSKIGK